MCVRTCARGREILTAGLKFFEAIKVVGDSPSYLRKIEKKYETRCVVLGLFYLAGRDRNARVVVCGMWMQGEEMRGRCLAMGEMKEK